METDYYRLLGVEPKAGAREIRRAYLRLARREHPDVNPGDRAAAARFARIEEAYRVLSHKGLREEYERRGRRPAPPAAPAGADAKSGGRQWDRVLRDVFHEGGAPDLELSPARGEDIHHVLELSFEDALQGAERECRYRREAPCRECGGRRWGRDAKVESCAACEGRGVVEVPRGPWTVRRICPACEGAGEAGSPPCPACLGLGHLPAEERRTVRVAAGSASGTRLLVRGAGQAGRRGGGSGDLVVTLKVHPHPFLERRGQNLYCTLTVGLATAVLGGVVRVPTPRGRSALRIPPGTQCGQQLVLRGRGVPSPEGGTRGDLYVTVSVPIPSGEDPRVRRAFQEYARAVPEGDPGTTP